MSALYNLNFRPIGPTVCMSVVCSRGNISVQSSEKVLPLIIEYSKDGSFKVVGTEDIISGLHLHPYKPNGKDFTEERLADLTIDQMMKQLSHFPTMPTVVENGKQIPHPVAEHIYRSLIYLKPDAALGIELQKMGYVAKTKQLPVILDKVVRNVFEAHKIRIDLFSVPKRDVGAFGYLADADGIATPAKAFSFGFHNAIPCDRLARELSSLKGAERFENPEPVPYKLPTPLKPYVTHIRVAICGFEESMLDGADLSPSCIPKIACKLSRQRITKDLESIEKEKRNFQYKPFRAGIEVVHVEEECVDETKVTPGTIRLIFPSGVKVAAQVTEQCYHEDGTLIDALMDFETFAKKGALAAFAMMSGIKPPANVDLEWCRKVFSEMKRERVRVGDTWYEGYVGYLPVMRPGQRYTELSKESDQITVDLIAKAILEKEYVVNPKLEKEYEELVKFRASLKEYTMSI